MQEVQGTAAARRTLFDEAGELAAGGEATPAVPAQPASASDAESVHLNQEGEAVCANCGAPAGTIWCVCAMDRGEEDGVKVDSRADLWGPVVTDASSVWFFGCPRGYQ